MQTRIPLTEWGAKERAGLLALETEEWREKHRIAEDPNTTADVLEKLGWELYLTHKDAINYVINYFAGLFAEAMAAHPNTPPKVLVDLLSYGVPLCFPAFCRNPITPLLILEIPDFWQCLSAHRCEQLLREATLPPAGVYALSLRPEGNISASSRLHIALAGEVRTQAEGRADIHASGFSQYENIRLMQFDIRDIQSHGISYYLVNKGTSSEWMDRLYAVSQLSLSTELFDEEDDGWNRSPLDLLNYLACDGNRLVRWATQTRLADPDFVFTWQDGP